MNILLILVWLVLLLLIIGAAYEVIFTILDRRRYQTPPGKLVDVGGHRLHILTMGERQTGQPVVILEAGVASNLLDWQKVQPEVAEFAQVVAYDRAGYGWSDISQKRRTPELIVQELHTLLQNAEIEPPYLLVGHSFGGIHVRLFAETFPDEVVGLILVDASNPAMIKTINTEPEIKRLKRVRLISRTGLVRAMLPRLLSHTRHLDDAARKQYLALNMMDSQNVMREALPMYGEGVKLSDSVHVPLIVISREPFEELESEKLWHGYQKGLAALSDDARHIYSTTSSHYIAMAEPEIVVRAIQEMVAQVSS